MLRGLSCLIGLVLLGAVVCAQEQTPIRWRFSDTGPKSVAPGETMKVRLLAEVSDGWHLYSMKELEGGPRPTRIAVPEGQLFSLAGSIEAPTPLTMHDPNFDMDVEFWVESTEFVVPVKVAAGAKPGPAPLTITAYFQSCNDKLCLPPRTVKLELPVEVRPK